ncbi:hypothetical protein [Actinomadura sp. NPDC048394]|jgi:hypothetical protein|uniref:hypothetical protein n=1 Tax=Actinomadura sp. NPDC048394 TaxID=3158223 RepID=UPI0033CFB739
MPHHHTHATTHRNCRDHRDHDHPDGRARSKRTARHTAPSRTRKTPPPCGPIRAFSYGGGWQSTAALVLAAQGHVDFRTFLFAITPNTDTLPFEDGDGSCDTGWCFA